MKKIINWTFGSVFRTFGRILAYISIGILLAFLMSKFDIKLNDLLGLPIVKAEVLENWSSSESRIRWDQQGTPTLSSWETTPHTWTPSYPVDLLQYRVKATNGLDSQNTYVLKFGYKPTPQAITPINIIFRKGTQTTTNEEIVCGSWSYNSNGYNIVSCSFTPRESYTSSDILTINVYFNGGYITDIRSYMYGFEERKSTNAVITDTGNQIIINIEEQTTVIENAIENSTTNIIEGLKDQNQVCDIIDKNNIVKDNTYLSNTGAETTNTYFGLTDYIKINSKDSLQYLLNSGLNGNYLCFYTINKEQISCINNYNQTLNQDITIPNNASYFRSGIQKGNNRPQFKLCKNGNQAINDNVMDLIHDINDNDTSNALNEFKAFFNLFNNNGHGLTSIISAPLNAINSLTSATCSPLVLPLPYMENKNITLPCMRSIYEDNFGDFMILYDTITFGIVSYWIILKLFKIIKEFKNPEDDKLEVVDL